MTDPKLIVALDFDNRQSCLELVHQLDPKDCKLKVGKELFTRFGPELVKEIQAHGFKVFLDLKFHDIPNTVAKAVVAAADLGVWMVNVHASGGGSMMMAAARALKGHASPPKLIAVTVLTSMDDAQFSELGIGRSIVEQVGHLAALSQQSELDGVVCSAQEIAQIKSRCGDSFLCITPGIRPSGSSKDDQNRTMTPEQAIAAGSDYIVVGRPITQAAEPSEVCKRIAQSIAKFP